MLPQRPSPRARTGAVAALLMLASGLLLSGCGQSSPSAQAASAPSDTTAAVADDGAAKTVAAPAPRHVVVSYPSAVVTMTGFYIAGQEGYLSEEGLDAEMVRMTGTASAQAMTAGQTDFGMSAGALLAAYVRGAPVRLVFVQIDKPLYRLFAQADVQTVRDLAGKSVGVGAIGDSTHLAASAGIRAGGQDPERITYLGNVTGAEAIAALESGAMTAAVVSPPFDAMAYRLGLRDLGFLGNYLDYLTSGLATSERHLREDPDLVQRAARAELKAHRYMQQNRAGTIEHMVRFQEVSPADAALAYDNYIQYLTRDGTSTPETLERILQDQRRELAQQGADPGVVSVDEAFRLEFARKANQELDQQGWRPAP
jgi:NitT/TauT family transport system substrate-binding protein